jgi:hypothetical protein
MGKVVARCGMLGQIPGGRYVTKVFPNFPSVFLCLVFTGDGGAAQMAEETRRSGRSRANHGADARLAAIAKYKSQRVCHGLAPHRKLAPSRFAPPFALHWRTTIFWPSCSLAAAYAIHVLTGSIDKLLPLRVATVAALQYTTRHATLAWLSPIFPA